MNNTPPLTHQATLIDVDRVIEPLASYLCATEQPERVLKLALDALYSRIEQTNRTADEHLAAFRESRLAVSA